LDAAVGRGAETVDVAMLEPFRRAFCRACKKLTFIFDPSFEAVCLFALLGIVLSALLFDLHARLMPPLPPIGMGPPSTEALNPPQHLRQVEHQQLIGRTPVAGGE
jgi:hypothetical protein